MKKLITGVFVLAAVAGAAYPPEVEATAYSDGTLIVTGDGEVLGRPGSSYTEPGYYNDSAKAIGHEQRPEVVVAPSSTVSPGTTSRLQIEVVPRNPWLEWPCPRGVKVLRGGRWGC